MGKRIVKCSAKAEIQIVTTGAGKTIIISEPDVSAKVQTTTNIDFSEMTKKELGVLLIARGIEHNQHQLKSELIDLLENADKR